MVHYIELSWKDIFATSFYWSKSKSYSIIYFLGWVSALDELPAMSTSCSIILCNLVVSVCLERFLSILPFLKFGRYLGLSWPSRLSWSKETMVNQSFLDGSCWDPVQKLKEFKTLRLTVIHPFSLRNIFFNESIGPPVRILSPSMKTFRHSHRWRCSIPNRKKKCPNCGTSVTGQINLTNRAVINVKLISNQYRRFAIFNRFFELRCTKNRTMDQLLWYAWVSCTKLHKF